MLIAENTGVCSDTWTQQPLQRLNAQVNIQNDNLLVVRLTHAHDKIKNLIQHSVSAISRQELQIAFNNSFTSCQACMKVRGHHF